MRPAKSAARKALQILDAELRRQERLLARRNSDSLRLRAIQGGLKRLQRKADKVITTRRRVAAKKG